MDRFNRKKDPIVIMGHLGVPTKKMVKGNECFIFYLCGLCSAEYANYFCLRPLRVFCGVTCYQIIASHAFTEKHFKKSDLLPGFTTSVALIQYPACVF